MSFARTAPLRPLGLELGAPRVRGEVPTIKPSRDCREAKARCLSAYMNCCLNSMCDRELRSSDPAPIAVLAPPHSSMSAEPVHLMTPIVHVVVPITAKVKQRSLQRCLTSLAQNAPLHPLGLQPGTSRLEASGPTTKPALDWPQPKERCLSAYMNCCLNSMCDRELAAWKLNSAPCRGV